MTKKLLSLLFALVLTVSLVSCSEDEKEPGKQIGGGDTDAEFESEAELATVNFKAWVADFASNEPAVGISVYAKMNLTDTNIGSTPAVSDADGNVEFNYALPADVSQVGFLCQESDISVNTYQWNITATSQDEKLWSVDTNLYNLAPTLASMTVDYSKGILAGGVYWVNNDGNEEPVSCSKVMTEDMVSFDDTSYTDNVRYFGDNGLPTDLATRDSVNPLVPYFLVGNIEEGVKTVSAYFDGVEIGSVDILSVGDSIGIGNIYVEGDSNPGGCD